MGLKQLQAPVDELVDSGVDTLFYCVGDTRVLLYDTKVGERWGHNISDWSTSVWLRSHVSLEMAREKGIDPLEVLCRRALEKDIRFIPTLLLGTQAWEDRSTTFHGRCSDFCFDHPEYCIDLENGDRRFNYNIPEVRAERIAVIEELLTQYPTDGIKLALGGGQPLCKQDEVDEFRDTLTAWLRDIRQIADRAAEQQDRKKAIVCQIPSVWDACWNTGLDVSTWLKEGLADWLVVFTLDPVGQLDQDMPLEPFVGEARKYDRKVFAGLMPSIQNDWNRGATKEMMHAAAANAYDQGVDGVALLSYYPVSYPWDDNDYGVIRHMGHPDLLERKDKQFRARSKTQRDGDREMNPHGYARPLPATLTAGAQGPDIPVRTADDLPTASQEGCLQSAVLSVRVTDVSPEDELRFYLNGRELDLAWAELNDYTFRMGYLRPEAGSGPYYWFDFALPEDSLPNPGPNVVRVDLVKRADAMAKLLPVTVRDVEILIQYRPHRHYSRRFQRHPISP
jgi:hypothetical protein